MSFDTLDSRPRTETAPRDNDRQFDSTRLSPAKGSTEAGLSGRFETEHHVATRTAPTREFQKSGRVWRWELRLLERLLDGLGRPPIAIAVWSGEAVSVPGADVHSTVFIHDRGTLWKVLSDPLYQFCTGYCEGRIEVSGNLLDFLRIADRAMLERRGAGYRGHGLSRWFHRSRRNTLAGSRENIHQHYDLGNEFYRLWLDTNLLYTCAYYARPEMTLEQAQIAKMDHVCRKLELKPGNEVIEAGCGWGGLALFMAKRYGVRVRAYNISHEQIRYAREWARTEGLSDRVEFVEEDWRNISGRCDAFVSVGMLEHVGPENYSLLGDVIHRCLKDDGRGLIHTIGCNAPRRLDKWTQRHIFPGAQPPSLSQMAQIFEPHGLSVLDVENLRLHYARTLEHWLKRYEQREEEVRAMFDEEFVRTWRLYLTSSIAAFESGWLQLFQVVFAPGTSNSVPWTREHLY